MSRYGIVLLYMGLISVVIGESAFPGALYCNALYVAGNALTLLCTFLHLFPQNDALQWSGMHNHWLYYIRYAGAFFAIGGSVLLLAVAVKACF